MSQAELQSERHEPLVSGGLAALTSLDQLVKAREAKGLSPSDLAVRLGMVPRQILAIERGDWTALPGRSFARSALRSYGRALGVDLSSLLPAIDSAFGQTQEYVERPALDQPMPRRGVLGFSSSGSGTWLAWTILVAVALVVLAFFYGGGASLLSPGETASPTRPQGSQGARPSSVAPTPAAGAAPAAPAIAGSSGGASASSASQAPASPVSSVPATSAGSAAVTPAAAPAQPGPAAPGAQPASSGGAATVAPTVPPAPTPSAAPAEPRPRVATEPTAAASTSVSASLALSFSEPSWIEIRDGNGRVLVTGTQPAGSSMVVEGALPISAVIGNAGRVTANWRGAPFDLTPHLRQGVARFNIE